MKLVSPYQNMKQYTNILIEPYHMNSDIKNNMKTVLQKKVENKCNKNGYVVEVYRIIEYSDGKMPRENLSGSAIFNITYHCKICIPVENSVIIGLVKVMNQELVIASNGPIIIYIPKENVDINTWNVQNNYLNKNNNKKLKKDEYIKIQIIDKRINLYDVQIKAIGKLLDYASDSEVEMYYGSKVEKKKVEDNNDSNFIN